MSSTKVIERSTTITAEREKKWRAITRPEHFLILFGFDLRRGTTAQEVS